MATSRSRPILSERLSAGRTALGTGSSPIRKQEAKPPRRNKRRRIGHDERSFYWLDEVADITGTSERTLERDIADGLLRATYIRGARRISDSDLRSYLRKCRDPERLLKRRRSPRKATSDSTGKPK